MFSFICDHFSDNWPNCDKCGGFIRFKMVSSNSRPHKLFKSDFHQTVFITNHFSFIISRVKWETERSEKNVFSFLYDFGGNEIAPERLKYVYTYTALIVIVLYLVFQRALALFYFCLKASRRIHEKLFHGVTRAQMYFFNTNSSGRIINRFSKDINDIDYYLPNVLYDSILVRQ